MNPHLQTKEVKQLKFLVETQLKITKVVLQEHKKQIQEENQNNILFKRNLEKTNKIHRKTKHSLRN